VYGGTGRAARNWECFDAIVRSLRGLENDETLLVQSGKPVGKFRTHDEAPRVLIANSNLVGYWSNYEQFNKLERLGLTMYGQMTAGSWIYIGSQGIVQGTFETFGAAGEKHFDGNLTGKLIVSGGLGGMGGAQPLAATMNGACFIGVEVDPARIEKRLATGYCDHIVESLDQALQLVDEARKAKRAVSVGLVGNCADVLPEMVKRNFVPDLLTDQTSAHDALNGYVPNQISLAEAIALRAKNPDEYIKRSMQAMADHVRAMLELQKRGAITFDYGNNIRTQAKKAGVENAYDIPGFVPEYIRPLFCEGKGPFRWVALSGDPEDIARTDALALKLFPENAILARWMKLAKERIHFQGLPAPPGFQFTTAVVSASAIRNMLGWSLLPTGPITPNGVSNACSPAIRGWGFCGMQMPVTRARLNLLPQKRSISRWHRGPATNELSIVLLVSAGERRQLACGVRQPAEHNFRRQAADECRLAACTPRNRRIFCLTLNVALVLQSN